MKRLIPGSTPSQWERLHTFGPVDFAAGNLADGSRGDYVVQVQRSDSVRDLRSGLLESIYQLKHSRDPTKRLLCVIAGDKLSEKRLLEEWMSFKSVLDSNLAERIQIVFQSEGNSSQAPVVDDKFSMWLAQIATEQPLKETPKGIAPRTVFAHLVRTWLAGQEAVPVKSIQDATLLSYPTVAKVLEDLQAKGFLLRTADRRVGLSEFPWDEWRRWSATGASKAETLYFVDPVRLPISPEKMASRLDRRVFEQIGISGVTGAKHHFPELDIRGNTRLDLVSTGSAKTFDTGVIRVLDSALEPGKKESPNVAVVVHFPEQRRDHLFQPDGDTNWADPLDCLSDLYEMGLGAQADEMVHFLIHKRASELKSIVDATGMPWRSKRLRGH